EGPRLLGRMTLGPRPKGGRGKLTHYRHSHTHRPGGPLVTSTTLHRSASPAPPPGWRTVRILRRTPRSPRTRDVGGAAGAEPAWPPRDRPLETVISEGQRRQGRRPPRRTTSRSLSPGS